MHSTEGILGYSGCWHHFPSCIFFMTVLDLKGAGYDPFCSLPLFVSSRIVHSCYEFHHLRYSCEIGRAFAAALHFAGIVE